MDFRPFLAQNGCFWVTKFFIYSCEKKFWHPEYEQVLLFFVYLYYLITNSSKWKSFYLNRLHTLRVVSHQNWLLPWQNGTKKEPVSQKICLWITIKFDRKGLDDLFSPHSIRNLISYKLIIIWTCSEISKLTKNTKMLPLPLNFWKREKNNGFSLKKKKKIEKNYKSYRPEKWIDYAHHLHNWLDLWYGIIPTSFKFFFFFAINFYPFLLHFWPSLPCTSQWGKFSSSKFCISDFRIEIYTKFQSGKRIIFYILANFFFHTKCLRNPGQILNPVLVGLDGRAFFYLIIIFFIFLVAIITKNTQILKKNLSFFAEKFWENILTYFQPKYLDFGQKTADFTRFLKNYSKNFF